MHAVWSLIHIALWIFIALMWIRFVVDWVQIFARNWSPTGFLLVVLEVVYSATDPPIKALRRVIPPLRIGTIALDLSFIIVMIVPTCCCTSSVASSSEGEVNAPASSQHLSHQPHDRRYSSEEDLPSG